MMAKRPHIIIFNPDEMRADALGHLGNPAAVTPNLDAFAAGDAVSFQNAFCQNPVCVPSRCSFFTGLYPHVQGHRTMTYLLRPGESSLFGELKRAGYHVWMNDRNDLYAGQYPGWAEQHADEIHYSGGGKRAPGPVNPEIRGERGNPYFYSHFEGQLGLDEQGKNYTADDAAVDAAIRRIGHWKEGDKPLCMFLGLFYPHTPYEVEEPYFSAIDRAKLPPRIRPEECSGKSDMMEHIRTYADMSGMTEDGWKELRAVYLGMCSKIDDQFGRLCAALKAAGIYDDSAVFVLSDHGDFTGDYGLVEKAQNCFEDCLTRVPLLVKPPKGVAVDPGVTDSLAELVDFYATAMELAGVAPDHDQYGKSLLPVVADRTRSVRNYAFCEGGRGPGEFQSDEYHQPDGTLSREQDVYWPKKMAQKDDAAHAKATMIRSRRYKYISRTAGRDELYDLQSDPAETTNRIDDPALEEEKRTLQLELLKWLQRTADVVPRDFDNRFTEEMLWCKVKGIVPPGCEEDVREKIRSGMGIGELFGYCFALARAKHN